MQAAMNAYNAGGTTPAPLIRASSTPVSTSLEGRPAYQASKNIAEVDNVSSSSGKERVRRTLLCPLLLQRENAAAWKWGLRQMQLMPNSKESSLSASAFACSPYAYGSDGSVIQGSRVARCLFNQTVPSPRNTSPILLSTKRPRMELAPRLINAYLCWRLLPYLIKKMISLTWIFSYLDALRELLKDSTEQPDISSSLDSVLGSSHGSDH